ncbi:hypothetical protein GCM10009551_049730 [Nocardiopsis tropica]
MPVPRKAFSCFGPRGCPETPRRRLPSPGGKGRDAGVRAATGPASGPVGRCRCPASRGPPEGRARAPHTAPSPARAGEGADNPGPGRQPARQVPSWSAPPAWGPMSESPPSTKSEAPVT